MNFLNGYKTYIIAAAGVLSALAALSQGQINIVQFVIALFAAASAITIRHGVNTSVDKVINYIDTVATEVPPTPAPGQGVTITRTTPPL